MSPPLAEHCTCSLPQQMHPSLHHMVRLDSGKWAAETWEEVRPGLRQGQELYMPQEKNMPRVLSQLVSWLAELLGGRANKPPSVFCTKPLASSFSWEGCSCPPVSKIHLIYPRFPKCRTCTSSWDRKLLELGSLTGCNFSMIFCINSSSYLTTNSAF